MSNYFSTMAQMQEATWTEETTLNVIDHNRSQFFFQSRPTEKLILFFHGFTAIPEQFAAIATAFFDAGYNVLVPRLPGHGLSGDWNADQPRPLPETISVYQDFALKWLECAQQLSKHIMVGGLSGGATLAAWLALEQPHAIDRAILFAPYLSNSNILIDWAVGTFDFYFKWRTEPGVISFGYEGFYMPSLRVFLDLGQEVMQRWSHLSDAASVTPMLIISSEFDQTTRQSDYEQLFQSISQQDLYSWYIRFDEKLKIPHNMMTNVEGNPHADLVIEIAKFYATSRCTWAEAKPIIEQMIQNHL